MVEKESNNQSGRGGARSGAGRKKGEPNRRTAEAQAKAEETGIMPLDYMLEVMRNSSDERMRMSAAVAAAPYVHAKLASIEVTGPDGGPVETVTRIELVPMRGNSSN